MKNEECRMKNGECGVRSADCALRVGQFATFLGFGEPTNVLQGTSRMILRALRAAIAEAEASNNPG
jgi:hypothetical protein